MSVQDCVDDDLVLIWKLFERLMCVSWYCARIIEFTVMKRIKFTITGNTAYFHPVAIVKCTTYYLVSSHTLQCPLRFTIDCIQHLDSLIVFCLRVFSMWGPRATNHMLLAFRWWFVMDKYHCCFLSAFWAPSKLTNMFHWVKMHYWFIQIEQM